MSTMPDHLLVTFCKEAKTRPKGSQTTKGRSYKQYEAKKMRKIMMEIKEDEINYLEGVGRMAQALSICFVLPHP